MKTIFILVFICFSVNIAFANDKNKKGGQDHHNEKDGHDDHNESDTGIRRPCPKNDLPCISEFFAHHAKCSPKHGYHGEVYFKTIRERNVAYLPVMNATGTLDDLEMSAYASVEDFHIDSNHNDDVVLVVNFRNLTVKSDNIRVSFNRRAKEPIVTRGTLFARHEPIVVTATIPNVNNIRLKDSVSYVYLTDVTNTVVELSPSIFRSKDPEVKLAAAALAQQKVIVLQEYMLTEGPFILAYFVQHAICDYGLNIL